MPKSDTRLLINNLGRLAAILGCLPILGTVGFMQIEGWNFLDSLYMSVITLSTVGFTEVHPLTDNGRIFVIGYLIVGLGGFLYALAQMGEIIVRTELRGWLGRRRMDKSIKNIKDHYIVCGTGRVGTRICHFLSERKLSFVAIEKDMATVDSLQRAGWTVVAGDATDDQALMTAGVERAKGICTVLSTDADNVYVVLSARLLNKDIQIISRGSDEKNVTKLKRAGANHVVSLYATGASKMAQLLANEKMEDFMEIFSDKTGELDLVELKASEGGRYVGRTLAETNFTSKGIMIVAIRQAAGPLQIPPRPNYQICEGDRLVAVGKAESVSQLTEDI